MAEKGMTIFTHQGEDFTINDPNNAPEFDASAVYVAGQHVTYQGDLYRLDKDHEADVTWANTVKTKLLVTEEINDIENAIGKGFVYMDFNIPAGQSGNLDFYLPKALGYNFQKVYLYYTSEIYDGPIRTFTAGYENTYVLSAKNTTGECPFPPKYIRLYNENMAKSGDTVIGGNVQIYFKPVIQLADPYINGKKADQFVEDITKRTTEMAVGALDKEYKYLEFTIPAGATENIDFRFELNNDENLGGVNFYYEADDEVYTNNYENGVCRIFATSYTSGIELHKNGEAVKMAGVPRYFRVYYQNMAKSGGTVVGGTIKLYYKAAADLTNPSINGKEFYKYFGANNIIPNYYEAHMDAKIIAIRDNMMEVGKNGETFIFITDTHWESNERHSPALVKYLLENLNVNVILNGGDLINQGLREPMAELMRGAISSFAVRNIPMLCAFGNHDSNWNDYNHQRDYPERYFDRANQYALMQKQHENFVTYFTEEGWNFYYDKPSTKTRFIVIDTGEDGAYSEANFVALGDALLSMPEGYHAVIMGHWFYDYGKSTACANLETMVDAYNAKTTVTIGSSTIDFSTAAGAVNLIIGGHLHNDMSWITTGGVPVVLTDCDAGHRSSNTDYPFVVGTITEQAFDVVTIDYTTGAVKAVRIGRGADRAWNDT